MREISIRQRGGRREGRPLRLYGSWQIWQKSPYANRRAISHLRADLILNANYFLTISAFSSMATPPRSAIFKLLGIVELNIRETSGRNSRWSIVAVVLQPE